MSGWIIGFASEANSPSEGTWRDSRLGGYAIWPSESHPEIPPCPLCNQARLLFLQAYAPHAAHPERFLVVFACNSAVCARDPASWCAYRGFQRCKKKQDEKVASIKPPPVSRGINWDSASDDSNATSESSLGELETMLNDRLNISAGCTSNINSKKANEPSTAVENAKVDEKKHFVATGRYFTPNFIEVEYEQKAPCDDDDTIADADEDAKIARLLKAYEAEERADTTGTTWCAEDDAEETDEVVANDAFRRVIERAPEQVLRYKFGGDPQWPKQPSPDIGAKNRKCGVCGSGDNVFEVQILGSALYFMGAEGALAGKQHSGALNFMAVAIYTCINDCEGTRPGGDGTRVTFGEGDYRDRKSYRYHKVDVVVQPDVW